MQHASRCAMLPRLVMVQCMAKPFAVKSTCCSREMMTGALLMTATWDDDLI